MNLNFDNWTYRDFADAFNYFRDGNSEELNKLLTKATGVDYDEMDIEESGKAKFETIQAMNKFVEKLDFSDCRVDFKKAKWNDKKYRQFQNAMASRNVDEVENLVREVAELEGVTDAPLTARQGVIMVRAITQKYQNILTGKN